MKVCSMPNLFRDVLGLEINLTENLERFVRQYQEDHKYDDAFVKLDIKPEYKAELECTSIVKYNKLTDYEIMDVSIISARSI